jgi:glycosyltransferase involved in cell wall biosynthesis
MIQKKRILFLSRLYHPHIGGVEKHVEELSILATKKGYEVAVITERFDKKLPEYEILNNVYVYRLPVGESVFGKKFLIWKWMLSHFNLLIKADIIHVHDVFFWILPYRILIPFKKVYITFHGYEGFPIKKGWILQRKIAEKLTNGNICVGDFMKKWYNTTPTSVIYGGVRLNEKNEEVITPSAVFFGRLDEQTGIRQYIEAYRKIKEKIPGFVMTIVGEGELARLIPKGVKVVGFKKDIYPFILKNRIVFVSRYLSMLEALALGREVVATYDNPVKKDYILKSPFKKFIHVGRDSGEIADIVIRLLGKNTSSARLKNSSKWARTQTWENVLSTYFRLWKTK